MDNSTTQGGTYTLTNTGTGEDGLPILALTLTAESKFNYIDEAHQTLSDKFHADKVSAISVAAAFANFIQAANDLDLIKKGIFYGRDVALPEHLVFDDVDQPSNYFSPNIIHGIIGIATEAGELVEALDKAVFGGDGFDAINMSEEVGDVFWYQAILAREAGLTFDQIQRNNIAKLRKRFPEKFTEYDANNRDLEAERAILESIGD